MLKHSILIKILNLYIYFIIYSIVYKAVKWEGNHWQIAILGRKVMINLDSLLKSRDVTFPTKVRLVKSMVFPVIMYGCESWTIKKAERQRIDAFELWC